MARTKGKVAEREVAALCKTWWTQLEPACEFVRTPMSGGWSGPTVRREFAATGDLMTTAKLWPFDVEVKRREAWTLANLLAPNPSPVWNWWMQTQRSAAESGREPMLWLRRNRTPWLVMVRYDYYVAVNRERLGFEPLQPKAYKLWLREEFNTLNVGALPVLLMAAKLLTSDPKMFARDPQTGLR